MIAVQAILTLILMFACIVIGFATGYHLGCKTLENVISEDKP